MTENSGSSPQRGEVGRGEYWLLYAALLPPPQPPAGGGSRVLVVTRFCIGSLELVQDFTKGRKIIAPKGGNVSDKE